MKTALIGLIGILLGVFLGEYFRRRSRVELYSQPIFDKRLKLYESLYNKLDAARSLSTDIIENTVYSDSERLGKWSPIVLDLAEYLDRNQLYIDEDIATHCIFTVVGVEEIRNIKNRKKREKAVQEFGNNINKAISMIKVETGLKEIDNLFKRITKAKHRSDFITEFKVAKEKYKKKQKLPSSVT